MKLLSIIPITKGINKENLSYFTSSDISIGSIVKIPLRKKTTSGIVVSTEDIVDVKAEIKNATYTTKKIEKIKSSPLLSPNFMKAVNQASLYFSTTSGSILNSIIPKIIIEEADKIKTKTIELREQKTCEKLIIQSDDEERYSTYKSLIREEFAKGHSVFFCLPTIPDIKKAQEKLTKGIEQYTFILHSLLSKKEQISLWNQAINEKHPILIISTGSFLCLPRDDLGTIIIDKENSRSYKNIARPFVDIRTFAEIVAETNGIKIIFGDLLLRTETIWRLKEGEIFEITPLKFRSLTTADYKIINMKNDQEIILDQNIKQKIEESEIKNKFKLFSQDLLELIKQNQINDENLFIFVARRGLFPTTICCDCNNIVKCNTCNAPTVLHKSTTENFFLCHRCGEHRTAMEKCKTCNSWKLGTFGIGIEAVEEELKEKFPNLNIFRIDSDKTNTHKKAEEIMNRFYTSPGSVLIGTEMSLLYLKEMIANTAVISIDSFFSIPDFRINEKVMNILLKIRANTSRNFLIQTRDKEQKIIKYAALGNLADFYHEEIKERQLLSYPPFLIPIKITLQGDKKTVLTDMEELQKKMLPYEIDVFPAFVPINKGKFSMHGLIKVKRQEWVDKILLQKLRELPPQYTINIDPESFL